MQNGADARQVVAANDQASGSARVMGQAMTLQGQCAVQLMVKGGGYSI